MLRATRLCLLWLGVCGLNVASAARDDRAERQAELDAACESARSAHIEPLRAEHVDECVRQRGESREFCERFYRDYGARSGNRPPLFYDLPECVEAFDFQNSQRRRGG